ncbi:pleiotropic drug resistance protein 7 [Dorcoceras hygrometricum]|uniref:Pleiotropic drug resistance protein 7 n=1 Tax=Dorcoceras hygrometricum TaxID=472368 RepID=A0A2Z7CL17_9LAMI|nr:pleiotropic drug resistance protein 7 [Dorcoceras hygrometricum]
MGTQTQQDKAGNKYEVKPQYEELSKQLGGRHSNLVVTTPTIALDFSGTTQQSASHNVAPNQMPPKRKGRASRQVMVDSRTLVSADREDVPQPSVPMICRENQPSAFRSLASAFNRAVDFMESLVVGQTRVRKSTGHSVDLVPSGTSSSQPSVASLKKLATINFEEMYRKEEQVLSWGETESPQEAIQRKFYILLKYRTVLVWKFLDAWRANFVPGQGSSAVDIQVIELLSDLYLSFLEELAKEARAHNLIWNKPCCSKIFEGSPRDRGAVIARTNSNTRSTCWIRKMIFVDGLWTVELCADKWVKIPRKVISSEVPRQRQFDDTLPSMSVFFRLMKKRWADVCLEVTDFCASRRLLPVGSINFCRALEIVETDSCFASRQLTVFSLRLSQFCTIHIQYSLFSSLSTADISDFLSSIALDRTAFRSVQIDQSVGPSVQLSLDQRPSSPTSSSSSSSLRFDQTNIDATASSRPPISQDLSAAFADLQANHLEQIFEYQSGLSSKLHKNRAERV